MSRKKIFSVSKELERGISETITTATNNVGNLRYEIIPLSRIVLDNTNPRRLLLGEEEMFGNINKNDEGFLTKKKEKEHLLSLSESIKKIGVRNAIEVYKDSGDYRLISGERRVLASKIAGKQDIQAKILESKPSAFDLKLLQWIENIEREDLNVLDKIENIKQIINAYTECNGNAISAIQLADMIGRSRQHATNLLAIVNAPDDVYTAVAGSTLANIEKIALIAREDSIETRRLMFKIAGSGGSIEDIRRLTKNRSMPNSAKKKKLQKTKKQKINLGYIDNIQTIKTLIQDVLNMGKYSSRSNNFSKINWDDCNAVRSAFKILLSIVESVSKDETYG